MIKEEDEDKVINEEQIQEPEILPENDRLALELAKAKRQVAMANAEKAVAQGETADIAYKYTVLQIYMKHGLTSEDTIQESTWKIIRKNKEQE